MQTRIDAVDPLSVSVEIETWCTASVNVSPAASARLRTSSVSSVFTSATRRIHTPDSPASYPTDARRSIAYSVPSAARTWISSVDPATIGCSDAVNAIVCGSGR